MSIEKLQDSAGFTHARVDRARWMVCGIIVDPTDVPLPDDATVDCSECRQELRMETETTPTSVRG